MPTITLLPGAVKSLPPTLPAMGRVVTLTSGATTIEVGQGELSLVQANAAHRERHTLALASTASNPGKLQGAMAVFNAGAATAVVDYVDSAL